MTAAPRPPATASRRRCRRIAVRRPARRPPPTPHRATRRGSRPFPRQAPSRPRPRPGPARAGPPVDGRLGTAIAAARASRSDPTPTRGSPRPTAPLSTQRSPRSRSRPSASSRSGPERAAASGPGRMHPFRPAPRAGRATSSARSRSRFACRGSPVAHGRGPAPSRLRGARHGGDTGCRRGPGRRRAVRSRIPRRRPRRSAATRRRGPRFAARRGSRDRGGGHPSGSRPAARPARSGSGGPPRAGAPSARRARRRPGRRPCRGRRLRPFRSDPRSRRTRGRDGWASRRVRVGTPRHDRQRIGLHGASDERRATSAIVAEGFAALGALPS